MSAALKCPDLLVGLVRNESCGARIAAEEVLPDERAVLALEGLVVAILRLVHQCHERAVFIGGKQGIPTAAPHHLDDVPPRTAEDRLKFLNDLAVAANRAVEALQIAVHHEGQVVEVLAAREPQRTGGLRFVHLAVTEERPHTLVGRVLDSTCVQVTVEAGLVDRVQRTEPHRDRRETPEVRHQPRVRVARESAPWVAEFLTEAIELVFAQPAFQVRARVRAGGGVALPKDLIGTAWRVRSTEEVVHADFIERGRRSVAGDVSADTDAGTLGPVHHDRGIPANVCPDPAFDVLVAGEGRLVLRSDGVDVVSLANVGYADFTLSGEALKFAHEIARTGGASSVDDAVQGIPPLRGLGRV